MCFLTPTFWGDGSGPPLIWSIPSTPLTWYIVLPEYVFVWFRAGQKFGANGWQMEEPARVSTVFDPPLLTLTRLAERLFTLP